MESLPVRLGLATEWIEICVASRYRLAGISLGLATEWIEMNKQFANC